MADNGHAVSADQDNGKTNADEQDGAATQSDAGWGWTGWLDNTVKQVQEQSSKAFKEIYSIIETPDISSPATLRSQQQEKQPHQLVVEQTRALVASVAEESSKIMDQVGKSVVLTRGVTVLENLGPSLSSFFTPQITFESHLTQLNVPSLLECLDLLRSKAFTATDVPQDEVAARARESLTSFFDEDSIMEAVDRAEIPQGHLRESASGIDEEVVGEIETAESSDVTDLASSTTAISQYTAASVRLLLLFAHRVPTMSDAPPVVGGRARDIAVSLLAGIKRLSTRHASIVSSDDVKVVHVNAEKATSIVMEALGAVGDIVKQRAGSAAATHS